MCCHALRLGYEFGLRCFEYYDYVFETAVFYRAVCKHAVF